MLLPFHSIHMSRRKSARVNCQFAQHAGYVPEYMGVPPSDQLGELAAAHGSHRGVGNLDTLYRGPAEDGRTGIRQGGCESKTEGGLKGGTSEQQNR